MNLKRYSKIFVFTVYCLLIFFDRYKARAVWQMEIVDIREVVD